MSRRPVGGYKIAYQYASLLAKRGHRVVVWHSAAFLRDEPGSGQLRSMLRAIAHKLRNAAYLRPNRRWFSLDARVSLRVTAALPRIRLRDEDVVVATASQTMRYAAQLSRSAGISIGLIQHHEAWGVGSDYVDQTWAQPDDLIVIAPWLQAHATSLGLHSYLLPNAMESDAFPPGPRLAERGARVAAMLSHLEFKRPDLVCAVLSRVVAQGHASAVAFGQMARPSELPSSVEYVENPSSDQLSEIYQSAAVYLCASDAEGWHLPPAEATLSGASVVSTDIGGVRASLEDDALYAAAGDEDGLFDAVQAVLSERSAAQARVDRASARLRARTPESNVEELESVFADVKRRRRAHR